MLPIMEYKKNQKPGQYNTLSIWFNWGEKTLLRNSDHHFGWSIQYKICIEPGECRECKTKRGYITTSVHTSNPRVIASWPPLISLMFSPLLHPTPPSTNVLQFFLFFCFQSIIQDKTAPFGIWAKRKCFGSHTNYLNSVAICKEWFMHQWLYR